MKLWVRDATGSFTIGKGTHSTAVTEKSEILWFAKNGMFAICLWHQLLLKFPNEQTSFTKSLSVLEGFLQRLGFFLS